MKKLLLAATLALTAATAVSASEYVSYLDYPQKEQDGKEFFTAIEIPQGSFTKYEINDKTGHIIVDRYQSMPVVYPARSPARLQATAILSTRSSTPANQSFQAQSSRFAQSAFLK
jgi:opacity protein-like surface antigen